MDNLAKYKKVFREIFDVRDEDLGAEFRFDNVQKWDSVAHMSLISALEDEFEVLFDTEDILSYGSFENGINILKKYGVTFEE
ncbi:MAG: acyl carrier protein [Synergistes sp.]|nr:acyl carrier protein [Synergistes sp.]